MCCMKIKYAKHNTKNKNCPKWVFHIFFESVKKKNQSVPPLLSHFFSFTDYTHQSTMPLIINSKRLVLSTDPTPTKRKLLTWTTSPLYQDNTVIWIRTTCLQLKSCLINIYYEIMDIYHIHYYCYYSYSESSC